VIRDFIAPRPVDVPVAPGVKEWVYGNGSATFWGYELAASYTPIPFVSVSGHLDYTRATDLELDEAVPGIPPFSGRFDFTASSPGERLLLEVSSEFALRTNRVAERREELSGDGYLIFHWWLGLPLRANVGLRVGVYNLFNTSFEPQPGLFNRENDMRIPGPGRSWLFSLSVTA
ncbi:MAG: TonB-dependent receptor, partial [Rhodothermia bacterium]|nr:TonB-dependent receptor [Rhodothermia bacterium]